PLSRTNEICAFPYCLLPLASCLGFERYFAGRSGTVRRFRRVPAAQPPAACISTGRPGAAGRALAGGAVDGPAEGIYTLCGHLRPAGHAHARDRRRVIAAGRALY